MIPLWTVKACAAVALLGGAWLQGRSSGAASVQAEWDAQRAIDAEAQRLARQANAHQATAAASTFEAFRARNAAALVTTRAELRDALSGPICPFGGAKDANHALQLADLPIPAAAVDRLRRAAAGGDPR